MGIGITRGIAAVALGLTLMAGTAEAQQRRSVIDKIIADGTLKVCVAVATPWMMRNTQGEGYVGFDVDMIEELTKIMQVKTELVPVPAFGQLIAALQSGRCDVIMTALTRTTQRAMAVAFTEPYFVLGTGWLVKKDRTDLNTLADLDDAKVTVAVEQGALSEQRTRTRLPKAQMRALPGGGDALRLTEVESGRSVAAAIDSIKVPIYLSQFPWAKVIPADVFDNPVEPSGLAYATRRDDLDFVNFLNVFIYNLNANGTIARLKAKWVDPQYIKIQ